MTAMSCCAVCDAIDECQAFVVALDVPEGSGATNCYLLTGAGGISRSANRASGTKGSWPPKPPTPAPTPAGGGGDDLVQYYYGSSNMVVAPVLSPIDYKQTSMADKLVWLPPTLTADEAAAGATAPVGWVERASQRLHFLSGAMGPAHHNHPSSLVRLFHQRTIVPEWPASPSQRVRLVRVSLTNAPWSRPFGIGTSSRAGILATAGPRHRARFGTLM